MTRISPSLLACDLLNIENEVKRVEEAGADMLHIDVMDGHFVPNITFGPQWVYMLKRITRLPLDVHLMLDNPQDFIDPFIEAGADLLTIHLEIKPHLPPLLEKIRSRRVVAGVAIKPKTEVSAILAVKKYIDLVLIMLVEPGFSFQKPIESTYGKVVEIKRLLAGSKCEISVDGGVSPGNAKILIENGATILVSGAGIFSSTDYRSAIDRMR